MGGGTFTFTKEIVMNNLVISYDLYKAGQNYSAVERAINGLGGAVKVNLSVWYVSSPYSAIDAANSLIKVMDVNDKLFVVDATHNQCAWSKSTDLGAVAVLSRLWPANK